MMRALSWFTMLGALIGTVCGTLGGYNWALWYYNPGNTGQVQAALCPCLANAQGAIETFVKCQVGGAIAGAIVLNIVGLMFRGKLARRAARRAAAGQPPAVVR